MSLGSDDDLKARIGGEEPFLALFDRDGDGVAETGAGSTLDAAKAYADSIVYGTLGPSHPGVNFQTPGPVPTLVIGIWAELAIAYAGKSFPGAGSGAPYAHMEKDALERLKRLARNEDLQLPTGAPEPYSAGDTFVSAPIPVFGAAATSEESDPDREAVNGAGGGWSGF
jgi:hypothetical protein